MDAEYQHNEELRASGEALPGHRPVRAVMPGKHSLRQLVASAQASARRSRRHSRGTGPHRRRRLGGTAGVESGRGGGGEARFAFGGHLH